jgi:hypothetical protein
MKHEIIELHDVPKGIQLFPIHSGKWRDDAVDL